MNIDIDKTIVLTWIFTVSGLAGATISLIIFSNHELYYFLFAIIMSMYIAFVIINMIKHEVL